MNGGIKPVISVCIPTYNRAELLSIALRSVLGEFDGFDVEVIVSDNASDDDTEAVVRAYQSSHPGLRYYKNETNIGLDDNAVACIRRAAGEYVFMFSDDDVLLPGSGRYLLHVIREFKPNLLYLNHRGFWETEEPDIVYRRKTPADRDDAIYRDGFKMFLDLYLQHFSAIILRRAEVIRYFYHLEEYKHGGYERGYAAVVLAHHVALESPPPFVFVGKCCVAVRNVLRNNAYNVAYTAIIDRARHYQNLRKQNLLSDSQLRRLMNKHVMRSAARVIVSIKGRGNPRFGRTESNLIWQLGKRFPLFYLYILPFLVLPRFFLVVPFYVVLNLQRLYRKIARRSVFE